VETFQKSAKPKKQTLKQTSRTTRKNQNENNRNSIGSILNKQLKSKLADDQNLVGGTFS
jgi:hypothetical protein